MARVFDRQVGIFFFSLNSQAHFVVLGKKKKKSKPTKPLDYIHLFLFI